MRLFPKKVEYPFKVLIELFLWLLPLYGTAFQTTLGLLLLYLHSNLVLKRISFLLAFNTS